MRTPGEGGARGGAATPRLERESGPRAALAAGLPPPRLGLGMHSPEPAWWTSPPFLPASEQAFHRGSPSPPIPKLRRLPGDGTFRSAQGSKALALAKFLVVEAR